MAHQYRADLEGYLAAHDIPFSVRRVRRICADRHHRLEAINGGSTALDEARWKVKASIVEGIVVFLSLFDENPDVYRAFCPRAIRVRRPAATGRAAAAAAARGSARDGACSRSELPSRSESGSCARARRDVEAGFPAGRARTHSEDLGQSRGLWRDICLWQTISRLRHRRRNRPDG